MSSSRVVLVTGGTSGIGLATVEKFAAAGETVYTCSRSEFDIPSKLPNVNPQQVKHSVVDVGKSVELKNWIQSIGKANERIDILINNAAFVVRKPIEDFSSDDFQQSLQVNLLAVLESTQTAIPFLQCSSDACVINLSSMAAVDPFPGFSIYGACKAFIEVFTQAAAKELTEKNIRCYSIRAGAVDTPLLHSVLPDFPREESLDAERIAELIDVLTSGTHEFPNGQPIEITNDNIKCFDGDTF